MTKNDMRTPHAMGMIFGPKCFLSSAFFIISIISIYGIVESGLCYLRRKQTPDIGEWPFNIQPILLASIGIHGLFSFVAFFAALAACFNRPSLLFGSGTVLLAAFACSIIFGGVSFQVTRQEILEKYEKTFRKGINSSRVLEWMNDVQVQHKCCGINSYMDWLTVDDSQLLENKIPSSCCRRDTIPYEKDCMKGKLIDSNSEFEKKIYSEGCGTNQVEMRKQQLERIGIELCVCAVISLCAAGFLYFGVTTFFLSATSTSSSADDNSKPANSRNGPTSNSADEYNNNISPNSGNMRGRKKIRKKHSQKFHENHHLPFKNNRGSSRNSFGNISKSKSFIMGDAPSNFLTPIYEERDHNLLKKNVDMLWYQSLDKNMSTLSTTANDISSTLLPGNKKAGLGCDVMTGMNDDEILQAQRNTIVYTLVSERPFTPSSPSQNCSSLYVNYSTKSPATATTYEFSGGQSSPTSSSSKQPRQGQRVSDETSRENELDLTLLAEPGTNADQSHFESTIKEQLSTDVEDNNIVNETNAPISLSQPQPSSKYLNPTSSVRSSTLATIDEESESAKGSPFPTKGASPASGSLTPETLSPKETQSELATNSNKEEPIACLAEVHSSNNNSMAVTTDLIPDK